MLKTVIIEDERPAREMLMQTLSKVSPDSKVISCITTVKEGLAFFNDPTEADIIFSDVQLPDGLSFEIFRHTRIMAPVIFITGYDDFMLNAFEYNGIDYLLKPVDETELAKALAKFRMLEKHFNEQLNPVNKLLNYVNNRRKTRLVVRKGLENISLKLEDVVLFYTENKIVYVTDNTGRKYLTDKNLGDLELELDENMFFRANRQYIVNINYIRGFKAYEKVKLQVDLTLPDINHFIVISQETAPQFRRWMYEA
jgi:DNA-binding LytR/AlgR family response regulator